MNLNITDCIKHFFYLLNLGDETQVRNILQFKDGWIKQGKLLTSESNPFSTGSKVQVKHCYCSSLDWAERQVYCKQL